MCGYLERMNEAIKFLGTEVKVGDKLRSERAEDLGPLEQHRPWRGPPLQSQRACFAKCKRITASEEKSEYSLRMLS